MSEAIAEVERRVRELYGAMPEPLHGVVHVVSCVRAADGRLHVIKIGPAAPKSARDFFLLNFWRAQCDGILTTAQVVRAEPNLSHELQGPCAAELAAYRRDVLGKREAPLVAIMSYSGLLPPEHRVFRDRAKVTVLTSAAAEPQLTAALGGRAEVAGLPALNVFDGVEFLRSRGADMIMIEAGPSTASKLYEFPGGVVQHLLVSVCEAPVEPAAIGGALPANAELFASMGQLSETTFQEESGPWRFMRWQRHSLAPA
jgi:riboflavin biosynthesis pyrimidine reductase